MIKAEKRELIFLSCPIGDISDIDIEKKPLDKLGKTVLAWEELIIYLKERIKCQPKSGLDGVPLQGNISGELKLENGTFVWQFWRMDSYRKFVNIKGDWEKTNWNAALFALVSPSEKGQLFYQENHHAIRCAIIETCQEWKPN